MDVLCYFGSLGEIFRRCQHTLKKNGIFGFSVEKPDSDKTWEFHPYGHFVHSVSHLQEIAKATGFQQIFIEELALRRELGEQRIGHVCLYEKIDA